MDVIAASAACHPTSAAAVEVAEAAPAPALPSPRVHVPTAAATLHPAPKTVPKPRSNTASSAQWPTRQSVVSTVSSAVVPQLFNSLFSGDLQMLMQHVRTGRKKVAATLPQQLPCGKAVIVTDRLVGVSYMKAIWLQLGKAVAQRLGYCGFSLWVDMKIKLGVQTLDGSGKMFRRMDRVQVEATLMWEPE
jgi:hypothetical protein